MKTDEDYLAWVREEFCCGCGDAPPNDAHHMIGHGRLSMSRKVDDRYTFALCRMCHTKLHDRGYKVWEADFGSQWRWVARTLVRYIDSVIE